MDKPRRRAAGRPAGPPNAVAPVSADDVQPAPPAGRRDDEQVEEAGQQAPAGQQHRRRQRAARQPGSAEPAAAADPAGAGQRGSRLDHVTADRPEGSPDDSAATVDTIPPGAEQARGPIRRQQSGPPAGREERRRGESSVERSLRALVSTRTTQLPPDVAMRAREVAAPTQADLAAAEAELVIVRRYYVPPAPLATAGKATDQRSTDPRSVPGKGRAAESRRSGRRPQRGTPG